MDNEPQPQQSATIGRSSKRATTVSFWRLTFKFGCLFSSTCFFLLTTICIFHPLRVRCHITYMTTLYLTGENGQVGFGFLTGSTNVGQAAAWLDAMCSVLPLDFPRSRREVDGENVEIVTKYGELVGWIYIHSPPRAGYRFVQNQFVISTKAIPLSVASLMVVFASGYLVSREFKLMRRARSEECLVCGYPKSIAGSSRCPECGTEYPANCGGKQDVARESMPNVS